MNRTRVIALAVGKLCRHHRIALGMTAIEAARRAEMPGPIYCRFESGRHQPSVDVMIRCSTAAGVPFEDLGRLLNLLGLALFPPHGGAWVGRQEPGRWDEYGRPWGLFAP